MKKKHIFINFNDSGLGGIQRKILEIITYLNTENEFNDVVPHVLFRERKVFFAKQFSEAKIHGLIHYEPQLPFLRRFQDVVYVLYVGYLLLRYKPIGILVFLHFQLEYFKKLTTLLFWLKPTLVVSQDTLLSRYNTKSHSHKVFFPQEIRELYSLVDTIVVQTKAAKKDLVVNFHIEGHKIKIIPNWVAPRPMQDSQRPIDIIFVGRLVAQKRLEKFLEVVNLNRKDKRLRVVIIGEGESKTLLLKTRQELNLKKVVTFLSSQSDIFHYLTQSKIFLMTSEFEGQSLSMLEAMMAGTIPVALEHPGLDEVIKSGKNGFIEKNVRDLSKRVGLLLEDAEIRQKVSHQARQYVVKKHNPELIKKTIQLLLQ